VCPFVVWCDGSVPFYRKAGPCKQCIAFLEHVALFCGMQDVRELGLVADRAIGFVL
jgi:hypothetical protein